MKECAALGELLDRIPAISKNPLIAIDECDGALARSGVLVRGVVAHHPEITGIDFDLAQVGSAYVSVLKGHHDLPVRLSVIWMLSFDIDPTSPVFIMGLSTIMQLKDRREWERRLVAPQRNHRSDPRSPPSGERIRHRATHNPAANMAANVIDRSTSRRTASH